MPTVTDTLKKHADRNHRIRMATARGDWDEYDRIVEECVKEIEEYQPPSRVDGVGVDLEGNEE